MSILPVEIIGSILEYGNINMHLRCVSKIFNLAILKYANKSITFIYDSEYMQKHQIANLQYASIVKEIHFVSLSSSESTLFVIDTFINAHKFSLFNVCNNIQYVWLLFYLNRLDRENVWIIYHPSSEDHRSIYKTALIPNIKKITFNAYTEALPNITELKAEYLQLNIFESFDEDDGPIIFDYFSNIRQLNSLKKLKITYNDGDYNVVSVLFINVLFFDKIPNIEHICSRGIGLIIPNAYKWPKNLIHIDCDFINLCNAKPFPSTLKHLRTLTMGTWSNKLFFKLFSKAVNLTHMCIISNDFICLRINFFKYMPDIESFVCINFNSMIVDPVYLIKSKKLRCLGIPGFGKLIINDSLLKHKNYKQFITKVSQFTISKDADNPGSYQLTFDIDMIQYERNQTVFMNSLISKSRTIKQHKYHENKWTYAILTKEFNNLITSNFE